MSKLEQLRALSKKTFNEASDDDFERIHPAREADMGGSGDAHEINWGDVTDVVREAVSQAFDHTVQECLSKMDMDQVDEAHRSLKDMQEYKEAQEIGDELAGKNSELLRRAHEEGMLIMAGAGTR